MISNEESRLCNSALCTLLAVAILAMPLQQAWGDSDDNDDDDDQEEYHTDYIFGVPLEPSEAWQLSSGGRIYDNWFNTLGFEEPEETHPALAFDQHHRKRIDHLALQVMSWLGLQGRRWPIWLRRLQDRDSRRWPHERTRAQRSGEDPERCQPSIYR